eukprot:COSAG01_NODE_6_length_54687_cov_500.907599_15_plen_377_part_00
MSSLFKAFEKKLMKRLIKLAEKQKGKTGSNPMVAAAVYNDHQHILGMAAHEAEGQAHAEILALNQAGSLAEGQHLMITLEPCTHQGKTGPCVAAIIQAKIRRVIFAVEDPNPRVSAQPARTQLEAENILVEQGLCQEEAKYLNAVFFKNMQQKLPYVSMKMGMSLDAKIAPSNRKSKYITGQKSLRQVHVLRKENQAILCGIGTILEDDPSLNVRHHMLKAGYQNPIKLIIDPELQAPAQAKIFTTTEHSAKTYLICNKEAQNKTLQDMKDIKILPIIEPGTDLSWSVLLKKCYALGINSILIEGGQQVFSSALSAKIVDHIDFFVAPIIMAGSGALSPFSINACVSLDHAIHCTKIEKQKNCDPDIWLRAYLKES